MDVLTQLISNVGFPIAMCLMLVWYINSSLRQMTTTIEALKVTVENNTTVVEKLNDRIDRLEKD